MTSREASDHLAVALGRMDALLVRLEAAAVALEKALEPASGAPVDDKAYMELIAKLKHQQAEAAPLD